MDNQRVRKDWPFADYEIPRMDWLGGNLYGASFFLMKLLPARFILQMADKSGRIQQGSRIIETTSGTFGLALAMISAAKGYKLTLVSDPAIDSRLFHRLRELGTDVEIIKDPDPVGGYQLARLNRLQELLSQDPEAFWPDQYANVGNPRSYSRVAEYLLHRLGQIEYLVGPVGSGGSMVGISHYLRLVFPEIQVIGVDTCHSILFGQTEGPRVLRGLGNSIMPANLDQTAFDYVSWVPGNFAFEATRQLHREHGIYMGGTSGAAYLVAEWWQSKYPDAKGIVIFPDEGHRYADTIYNETWLAQHAPMQKPLPDGPKMIHTPQEDEQNWTFMNWNRRTLKEVMTNEPMGVV